MTTPEYSLLGTHLSPISWLWVQFSTPHPRCVQLARPRVDEEQCNWSSQIIPVPVPNWADGASSDAYLQGKEDRNRGSFVSIQRCRLISLEITRHGDETPIKSCQKRVIIINIDSIFLIQSSQGWWKTNPLITLKQRVPSPPSSLQNSMFDDYSSACM